MMQDNNDRLFILYEGYIKGKLSAAEAKEFWQLMASVPDSDPIWEAIYKEYDKSPTELLSHDWKEAENRITPGSGSNYPAIRILSGAAAVLLVLITLYYFLRNPDGPSKKMVATSGQFVKDSIVPGHNGAIVQLSNGSRVLLDSTDNGIVATDNNVHLVKSEGKLIYTGKSDNLGQLYNTVSTPRGRQWQLILNDGTRVWLNASSSIRYPLFFSGKERRVEITGEVYFEVAHNKAQPFKVQAGSMLIEDIGTAFDVCAYNDEPFTTATLVSGRISVSKGSSRHLLVPGQQAATKSGNNDFTITNVNTQTSASWKDGMMVFEKEELSEVMRKISRWYDVDVQYTSAADKKLFSGTISRQSSLDNLISVLQFEGVHIIVRGKKLIVNI